MKKYLALVLVAVMLLSLVACGGETNTDTSKENVVSTDDTVSTNDTVSSEDAGNNPDAPSTETTMKIEKLATVDVENRRLQVADGGIIYQTQDKMYGIMTFDGKNDTGAKYTSCEPEGNYFIVATTTTEPNPEEISTLNYMGLVDAKGTEILPCKYAHIEKRSDTLYEAIEATEKTTNKDEAVLFYSKSQFAIVATEDDLLYKGNGYIVDVVNKKTVEGVDSAAIRSVQGNTMSVYKDGNWIWVNNKGEKIPTGADVFANGWYAIQEGPKVVVYDSSMTAQFSVEPDAFVPFESEGEYLYARKETDNNEIYVIMDKKGNVISAEMDPEKFQIEKCGNLIFMDDKIYNLKGENIIDGTFDYIYYDEIFKEVYFLEKSSDCTMIDENGTVLYQGKDEGDINVDYSDTFTAYQTKDYDRYYYSVVDKDYTLKGNGAIAPTLIQQETANGIYSVTNTVTEEVLLKGYQGYVCAADANGDLYILAQANTKVDIYLVK